MRILAATRGYRIAAVLTGLAVAGGAAIFLAVGRSPDGARPISFATAERDGAATREIASLLKDLDLIRPSRAQAAKDFSLPTPEGKTFRLADHRGKVVFLNFWATWCPPCKEEMPAMERLYQRFKERGFVVLAVSVDVEGAALVNPFVREHQLTFPIALDPKMAVAEQYGVRGLPSSFLVDKRGTLIGLALGPREWNGKASRALIESLLRD
ncbi:MAG: TlpA family protein disulfide reductase [Candidatus Rokubacteria bacterium]|nr:TlpA family protein disulfide reductase [Candidatus Rokubacteria bacterium]